MYDCVIIGSGPAGVSAAIYTARADLSTLVLGDPAPGHLYTSHIIANYFGFPEDINGKELMLRGIEQAKRFGAAFRTNEVVKVQQCGDLFRVEIDTKEFFDAKSILIATGMTYKSSGIPKEKTFIGKGLSYCVTCDGAFFKGKKVFVVGSGSFAAEEALALRTFTDDITMINQRSPWHFSEEFAGDIAHYGIRKDERKITQILTNEHGMVCGVQFDDGTEASGEGIFVAVGTAGPVAIASQLGVALEGQYIKVDTTGRTSVAGVYAAGNCTGAHAQVAVSVGMGCSAAIDIIKTFRGQRVYVDYN